MLKERILKTLKERREKVLSGRVNCIPLPFHRFRKQWPGIEQERIYLVSGATKSGKSMISLYLFVINTVMYKYHNPDKVVPKIFYFPLEESPEAVTLKVMCYFIAYITKDKIIIDPTNLKSTDSEKPLSQEILDIMEGNEFNELMNLYESIVTFYDSSNRIGIYKTMKDYALTHGESYYKTIEVKVKDELTGEIRMEQRRVFDYYAPNNPDEYVICIVDHISLLTIPKGDKDLRDTISKFSENIIELRNRYRHTFVVVQQQSLESTGLDAFKSNKVTPTIAGLSDCKDTGKACNMMLGILNPFYFEYPEWSGYSIKDLRGNARFVTVVVNRDGISNGTCPLFFIGEICKFLELPEPSQKEELIKYYNYVRNKGKVFFSYTIDKPFKVKNKAQHSFLDFLKKLFNKINN